MATHGEIQWPPVGRFNGRLWGELHGRRHASWLGPTIIFLSQKMVGDTRIKNDVTSSTFAHVPDAPVSSFELTLPEGKYSALAAVADLCTSTRKASKTHHPRHSKKGRKG